jgi:hypothetical protein
MFTLALLLALSTKPTLVCVGFTDTRCDFTYATFDQAFADAPDQSLVVIARTDHLLSQLVVIDRSYRQEKLLMQQYGEMQQKLIDTVNAAIRREYERDLYPNGCSPQPLARDACGQPPTLVQL